MKTFERLFSSMKQVIILLCSLVALTTAKRCTLNDHLLAVSCPLKSNRPLPLLDCVDFCKNEKIPAERCQDYPHCCGNKTNCYLKRRCPSHYDFVVAECPLKRANLPRLDCVDLCTGELRHPSNCSDYPHCCGNETHCFLRISQGPSSGWDETVLTEFLRTYFSANFRKDKLKQKYLKGNTYSPYEVAHVTPFPNCSAYVTNNGHPLTVNLGCTSPPPPMLLPPPFGFKGSNMFISVEDQSSLHKQKFPHNCKTNFHHSDMSSLVKVPYCSRIPCSPSDPLLNHDLSECVRHPGCYFDYELFQYRRYLRQGVLPGVPACHLTIRHPVFHRHAAEYVKQHGSWNPLLTKCLLNEHREKIFGGSSGCYLVGLLEESGHYAKTCGWKTITKSECYLIGCCWGNHRSLGASCVSPVLANQINIHSENDEQEVSSRLSDRDRYSLPTCLPFPSDATGSEFLDNYHICLRTGCAVNVDRNTYKYHLCLAGSSLPFLQRKSYIDMINAGTARPDNYRLVLKNLITNTTSEVDQIPLPVNPDVCLQFRGRSTSYSQTDIRRVFKNRHPQCPFRSLKYPGFKPLQGKSDGCCDKPFCYYPRSRVSCQFSGVSAYLSPWSDYGACSKECGGGLQRRMRSVIGKSTSRQPQEETRPCNTHCCIKYRPWTEWSPCKGSSEMRCGKGLQGRSRECYCGSQRMPGKCGKEPSWENRICIVCTCPTFQYSDWSPCHGGCCQGLSSRTRNCSFLGTCPQAPSWCQKVSEMKHCSIYCDKWVSSANYRCNQYTCLTEPKCLADDGSPGNCCDPDKKPRRTYTCCAGKCRCEKHCYFKNRYHCMHAKSVGGTTVKK
ncbi:unnamed protein product [Clavelina lepadiformis]|uniref:Uncharacterized protein n=1 Tax=Clavelina lepadiformis TaxID=159417 RepID=A0ABP0G4W2_CLALP